VRGVGELRLSFYRAEGEEEEAAKAVGVRSVGGRPLMVVELGWGSLRR
jgi:hypothetical protein